MKKLASAFFGLIMLFMISSCNILNKYAAYPSPASYHILNVNGETYNDSVQIINIDWISGRINVQVSEQYEGVTVFEHCKEQYKDELLCRVLRKDENLNIKFCASNVSIPSNISKVLEVYIPSNKIIQELTINNVSSTINISKIHSQKITIDNISGSTKIEECMVNELDYDGVSGSLICLMNQVTTNIEVDQVSGSTLISLPSSIAGFNIDFSTVSGSLNSDFNTRTENDKIIYKDENYLNIQVDSISGSVSIVRYESTSSPIERESIIPSVE